MLNLIFRYRLKIHLHTKESMFWLLLFPIILATLFYFAFGNLLSGEKMDKIKLGIVNYNNINDDSVYYKIFNSNEFDTKYIDKNKAEKLLNEKEIVCYIVLNENHTQKDRLVIKENGIEQTIVKEILDNIHQKYEAIKTIDISSKEQQKQLSEVLEESSSYIKNVKASNNDPDLIATYFYTVLAMAAIYGAISGMQEVNFIQANQSKTAMRIGMGSISKMKIFLTNFLATCLIQSINMILILLYIMCILRVNFGNRYLLISITSILGGICGVSIGTTVGALIKKEENFKIGIIISVTMLCCFLSGMMSDGIRTSIKENIPILDKINPVAVITDCYYQLYYFESLNEYMLNMCILIFLTIICLGITIFVLRRQKYDSI